MYCKESALHKLCLGCLVRGKGTHFDVLCLKCTLTQELVHLLSGLKMSSSFTLNLYNQLEQREIERESVTVVGEK